MFMNRKILCLIKLFDLFIPKLCVFITSSMKRSCSSASLAVGPYCVRPRLSWFQAHCCHDVRLIDSFLVMLRWLTKYC